MENNINPAIDRLKTLLNQINKDLEKLSERIDKIEDETMDDIRTLETIECISNRIKKEFEKTDTFLLKASNLQME